MGELKTMREISEKREKEIEKLKELIDDVKESVDRSNFGPMFMNDNELDFTQKQVNQLAWTLYLHLISPLMKQATEPIVESNLRVT